MDELQKKEIAKQLRNASPETIIVYYGDKTETISVGEKRKRWQNVVTNIDAMPDWDYLKGYIRNLTTDKDELVITIKNPDLEDEIEDEEEEEEPQPMFVQPPPPIKEVEMVNALNAAQNNVLDRFNIIFDKVHLITTSLVDGYKNLSDVMADRLESLENTYMENLSVLREAAMSTGNNPETQALGVLAQAMMGNKNPLTSGNLAGLMGGNPTDGGNGQSLDINKIMQIAQNPDFQNAINLVTGQMNKSAPTESTETVEVVETTDTEQTEVD